jgi:hypothetical protein
MGHARGSGEPHFQFRFEREFALLSSQQSLHVALEMPLRREHDTW